MRMVVVVVVMIRYGFCGRKPAVIESRRLAGAPEEVVNSQSEPVTYTS